MNFTLNGEPRSADAAPTVADLVDSLVGAREGVAVAVDGAVVPASAWEETRLTEGADVDVLTAVQGG